MTGNKKEIIDELLMLDQQEFYKCLFKNYTMNTDEKSIFFNHIMGIIDSPNKNILDIGTGDGVLTKMIQKKYANITGVEENAVLARYVESKLKIKIFKYHFGDHPDYFNKKFDYIISSYSLPIDHADIDSFIKEAANMLYKKGILIIITYNGILDDWNELQYKICSKVDIDSIRGFSDKPRVSKIRQVFINESVRKHNLTIIENKNINTTLFSKDYLTFFKSILFLASAGDKKYASEIMSKYDDIMPLMPYNKKEKRYKLQLSHQFIVARKEG